MLTRSLCKLHPRHWRQAQTHLYSDAHEAADTKSASHATLSSVCVTRTRSAGHCSSTTDHGGGVEQLKPDKKYPLILFSVTDLSSARVRGGAGVDSQLPHGEGEVISQPRYSLNTGAARHFSIMHDQPYSSMVHLRTWVFTLDKKRAVRQLECPHWIPQK